MFRVAILSLMKLSGSQLLTNDNRFDCWWSNINYTCSASIISFDERKLLHMKNTNRVWPTGEQFECMYHNIYNDWPWEFIFWMQIFERIILPVLASWLSVALSRKYASKHCMALRDFNVFRCRRAVRYSELFQLVLVLRVISAWCIGWQSGCLVTFRWVMWAASWWVDIGLLHPHWLATLVDAVPRLTSYNINHCSTTSELRRIRG